MMAKQNTYIAIDLKSFYASVECKERNRDPLTTNLVVADKSLSLIHISLPTVRAVCFGTPKAAESRCLWCSMLICCKKRWTARRLLLSQTETTLTTSFTVSLQSAKTF